MKQQPERVIIRIRPGLIIWFILLGFNAFDLLHEIRVHSWLWFAADIAATAFCAYMIHRDWPKPEKPKALDRTKDLRDIWKDK
jgi:hypothetical protein